jgi:enoyl-CoA hydratase/carnithine racemase
MDFEHIELHVGDTFARLTLNRPDRRNALSLALMREMLDALETVAAGKAPVLVIEGRGPAFSAGHDLAEIVATREAEFYEELFSVCVELMTRLHTIPQPVIAKVHGVATAAGCQLVAACDLAVAVDTATFATPGVRIGLFCSTPMVPLTRAIGRKRALQMLLTGEPISAATALDWGLVNQVVPVADLDAAVGQLADQILRFSPRVIGLRKRAFYDQIERAESEAYAVVQPVMTANAADPDAQEGIAAFLEKRQPNWASR